MDAIPIASPDNRTQIAGILDAIKSKYQLTIYHLFIYLVIWPFSKHSDDALRGFETGHLLDLGTGGVFALAVEVNELKRFGEFSHTFLPFCYKETEFVTKLLELQTFNKFDLRFAYFFHNNLEIGDKIIKKLAYMQIF